MARSAPKLTEWPFKSIFSGDEITQALPPGIYFNLPFSDYCKQPCLNAGGIKDLLVSTTDYWFRSFMNPLNDEVDEETKAKIEGRAYHKMILEGRQAFYDEYAPDFEYTGKAPVLKTSEEIAGALAIRSLPTTFKRKSDGIARLLAADPSVLIYDELERIYKEPYAEKKREFLPSKVVRHIEFANKMIESHPELKTYFVGGYPEVTIIWDDEELGVRLKMRADYLKVAPVVDLKTFANQMKKNLDKAINYAVASMKYPIQARLYLRGREAARKLIDQGKVFGAENVDPKWLKAFRETPNDEFWYVFQQKGIAPVSRGAKFSLKDPKFESTAYAQIEDACISFRECYTKYGTDPWIDDTPSRYLSYDELPAFVGDL